MSKYKPNRTHYRYKFKIYKPALIYFRNKQITPFRER